LVRIPLCRTTWISPLREVSTADIPTSPLPCTACPSPIDISAAGVDRQEQAGSGLQVMVVHVAAEDVGRALGTRPIDGGGATPMTPQNGLVGTTTPGARIRSPSWRGR
jgi:hypothetical protein